MNVQIIDKNTIFIGIIGNICKKRALSIHVKCVIKMGWNHNNCYYCCHDCMVGGKLMLMVTPLNLLLITITKIIIVFLKMKIQLKI